MSSQQEVHQGTLRSPSGHPLPHLECNHVCFNFVFSNISREVCGTCTYLTYTFHCSHDVFSSSQSLAILGAGPPHAPGSSSRDFIVGDLWRAHSCTVHKVPPALGWRSCLRYCEARGLAVYLYIYIYIYIYERGCQVIQHTSSRGRVALYMYLEKERCYSMGQGFLDRQMSSSGRSSNLSWTR